MTRLLGLIPARGGSKGIPRKNIRPIAGKPLIAWTIEAARSAGLAGVVVSTEDAEIAQVSREWGADVPFLRPPELSADDTPGIAPVLHALEILADYDAVLLLQPTSPLRNKADIEAIVAMAEQANAPSAISVCLADAHPSWMYRLGDDQRLAPFASGEPPARRQDLASLYCPNGALYFARRDWLRQSGTFVTADTLGYVMPAERSIDIDLPLDWKLAELLLGERGES